MVVLGSISGLALGVLSVAAVPSARRHLEGTSDQCRTSVHHRLREDSFLAWVLQGGSWDKLGTINHGGRGGGSAAGRTRLAPSEPAREWMVVTSIEQEVYCTLSTIRKGQRCSAECRMTGSTVPPVSSLSGPLRKPIDRLRVIDKPRGCG